MSESWRPNQVLHQNKKGMSTINQAVRKKSARLLVDIRWRARVGGLEEFPRAISSRSKGSECGTCAAMLGRLGCRRLLGRSGFVFLQKSEYAAVAKFHENVEKEDS